MKRVETYSKKNFWSTLFVLFLILIFSIFQIIMTWIKPFMFSWFIIPFDNLPGTKENKTIALKIVSMIISSIVLLGVVFTFIKSKKLLARKVYMNSWKIGLMIVVITFLIFFLIPSATPVNYILPIVVLFWYVVSLF